MLKASLMGLNKKLFIYTDNQGVCSKWRTCKPLELLSRGFPGVYVKFIKREKNTEADGLIRQNSILQLPRDKMNEVISAYLQRNVIEIKSKEMIFAELEESRKCYEQGEYEDFDSAMDEIAVPNGKKNISDEMDVKSDTESVTDNNDESIVDQGYARTG